MVSRKAGEEKQKFSVWNSHLPILTYASLAFLLLAHMVCSTVSR